MSDILGSRYGFSGEMARREILRTGMRPLVGEVALLGDSYSAGTGTTYRVHILRRRQGYVVVREHLTIWEHSHSEYSARLCPDAKTVLKDLGGDEMRRADQEAWEEACAVDEDLARLRTVEM